MVVRGLLYFALFVMVIYMAIILLDMVVGFMDAFVFPTLGAGSPLASKSEAGYGTLAARIVLLIALIVLVVFSLHVRRR